MAFEVVEVVAEGVGGDGIGAGLGEGPFEDQLLVEAGGEEAVGGLGAGFLKAGRSGSLRRPPAASRSLAPPRARSV